MSADKKWLAMPPFTVDAPLTVSRERVADTICAALEGGSNYWCNLLSMDDGYPEGTEWGHEAIAAGAKFSVHDGVGVRTNLGGDEKLTAALGLMATKHEVDFKNLIDENEDAETGDVLFQLICFGEVVFG